MGPIGTLSSVMTQAMMMKPPLGQPAGATPVPRTQHDNDGDDDSPSTVPSSGSIGRQLDIKA